MTRTNRSLVILMACFMTLAMFGAPTAGAAGGKDGGSTSEDEARLIKEEQKAQKKAEKQAKKDEKAAKEQAKEDKKSKDEGSKKDKKSKDESNGSEDEVSPSSAEGDSQTQSKTTSSTSSPKDGKSKCVSYYFRYTDGDVDSDDNWCGGNDIYRTSYPSLHVAKLHVSCSDTIYPDGTAAKADLDGHLVAEWWIIKDGKQCQGFVTSAEEEPELCPAGTDMSGEPMPAGGVEDCDEPDEPVLCPAGTDMSGEPMPAGGVEDCNDEVLSSTDSAEPKDDSVLAQNTSGAPATLPLTGGDVIGMVAIALMLLAGGAALVRVPRFKRNKN